MLIPAAAYCPAVPSNYTRATDPLPSGCFVKKPCLTTYKPGWGTSQASPICESVLKEVEACEIIRANPHPNIARYLGCQVQDGRITGICYALYDETLLHRVNPGSHMKRAVVYEGTDSTTLADALSEVEKGLIHLHSLGLVHNDINPSNIMFEGDIPVIIDFDSCRPIGESLERVGRTYEWYDEAVKTSKPSNDLDALDEIREMLKIGSSKNFKFKA